MARRRGAVVDGVTLSVGNLSEFLRACNKGDKETKRYVRKVLRETADKVRGEARSRFTPVNARSAAGYKTRVRIRGIAVEQSINKTTGDHPEWGVVQMRRALLPALYHNEAQFHREMEVAIEKITRHFNAA